MLLLEKIIKSMGVPVEEKGVHAGSVKSIILRPIIEGAGHIPFFDQVDKFNNAVKQFLI